MILAVLLQASEAFFFPVMLTTFFSHLKRHFISPKTTTLMLPKYPTILDRNISTEHHATYFGFVGSMFFFLHKVIIMTLAVLLQASVAFFFPGMLTIYFSHLKRHFYLSENNSANVAKISHYFQKF